MKLCSNEVVSILEEKRLVMFAEMSYNKGVNNPINFVQRRQAAINSPPSSRPHVTGGHMNLNMDIIPELDSSQQTESAPIGLKPHEFIRFLYGKITEGYLEVCYLAPEGVKLYPHTVVQWAALPLGDIDPELPTIKAMNERGYSCYFGCTVKACRHDPVERISDKTGRPYLHQPRSNALDALYVTALWIDIDEPGIEGYRRAVKMNPPASMIVSSGGGYHAYWLLSKPIKVTDSNRDTIKQTLKGMAIACGSDTKVADLARIMRLPGTINTKPGRGTICEVVDYLPCYYDYTDLELTYAPLATPKQPIVKRAIPQYASKGMPRWMDAYLSTGAMQGGRNQTAYAAMRWLLDNGYGSLDAENLVTARALSDGLTQEEISTLIRSALNAPRNAPELPTHMKLRMGAADKRLGGRK